MAKAKKRKTTRKSAKRSVKKRKAAPKRKAVRRKVRRAPKETTILDKLTGAAHEAAALRRKLEGPNTFED